MENLLLSLKQLGLIFASSGLVSHHPVFKFNEMCTHTKVPISYGKRHPRNIIKTHLSNVLIGKFQENKPKLYQHQEFIIYKKHKSVRETDPRKPILSGMAFSTAGTHQIQQRSIIPRRCTGQSCFKSCSLPRNRSAPLRAVYGNRDTRQQSSSTPRPRSSCSQAA